VDVRVIAATHRDLEACIAERTFREDLYYRLNVITIRIPPLRDRAEDILPMTQFLLKKHCPAGLPLPTIPGVLRDALLLHTWPGNIRELENTVRRLIVMRNPETIAEELHSKNGRRFVPAPVAVAETAHTAASHEPILEQVTKAKQRAETDAILAALNAARWNRKRAAAVLGIDYKALLYKMKKLSIEGKFVSFPAARATEEPEEGYTRAATRCNGQ
jgi:two-component system, NtrC family, response regulator AtoC